MKTKPGRNKKEVLCDGCKKKLLKSITLLVEVQFENVCTFENREQLIQNIKDSIQDMQEEDAHDGFAYIQKVKEMGLDK